MFQDFKHFFDLYLLMILLLLRIKQTTLFFHIVNSNDQVNIRCTFTLSSALQINLRPNYKLS